MNNLKDDIFLRNLIQKTELDGPSEGFVERVMGLCYATEIKQTQSELLRLWFKKITPYLVPILIFIVVSTFLIISGITVGPTLFSFLGSSIINIFATLKLANVGLIIGILAFIILVINKLKQPKLVLQVS